VAFEHMQEQEAATLGMSREAFFKREVTDKIAEPKDDEVQQIFTTYRQRLPGTDDEARAEVRRVLRPGGRFVCVEHVAAPVGSRNYGLQRMIKRPWKWVFEGCDLCHDTDSTLRSAGFAQVDVQSIVLPTIFVPIRHQIAAVCVN